MLKDILIKTAELINRDDIIAELNNPTVSPSQSLNNDILRLISYYNYTIESLCENYFEITETQNIFSDANRKINYYNFNFEPLKILSVKDKNRQVYFSEYSKYISVPNPKTLYNITYKFLPDRVTNINSEITLPKIINQKIVCYGIASEFLASKNQYNQSEFWNNKYHYEIFKLKTNKDRRIKNTFVI